MRKQIRLLAGLLCLLLFLTTACSTKSEQTANDTTAKGRFVETDVTPKGENIGNIQSLIAHKDGKLDFFAGIANSSRETQPSPASAVSSDYVHYRSTNGTEWDKQNSTWQSNLDGNITGITAAEDGKIYTAVVKQAEDFSALSIKSVTADGTIEELPVASLEAAKKEKENVMCMTIKALPQSRLLAIFTYDSKNNEKGKAEMALLDASSGQEIADLTKWIDSSYAANSSALLFLNLSGEVSAVSLSDGKPLPEYTTKIEKQVPWTAIAVDDDKDLYYFSDKGLNKLALGGSLVETIMESSMFTFSSPVHAVTELSLGADGSFYMTLIGEKSKLLKYTYDPNMSALPDRELKVYSLKDSVTIQAAITLFLQSHPDVRVDHEIALSEDSKTQTAQDALRTLNTELLAGGGPDVLLLDGMPINSYIEKGVLSDLTGLVSTDGLAPFTSTAFAKEKKMYAVPARMAVPLLFGPKDLLKTPKTFENIVDIMLGADNTEGLRPVTFDDLDTLYNLFYNTSAPSLIDSKNEVKKENLRLFLQSIKDIAVKYGLKPRESAEPVPGMSQGFNDFVDKKSMLGYETLDFIQVTNLALVGMNQSTAVLCPGISPGAYLPSTILGINAQSKQKELAADFLNTALSEEVQNYLLNDGLSVRVPVLNKQLDNINKGNKAKGLDALNVDFGNIVNSLSTPVLIDNTIKSKLFDCLVRFCSNEATLDQTISAVDQEVKLYLAEKQ